jgi:hypothetical protein
MGSLSRIAMYGLLGLAILWYFADNFAAIESGLALPSDFGHYHDAGQRVLRGATPYTNSAFNYPPILAFAMTPLAPASYLTARWIWLLVSHAMLLTAGILVWRFLGGGLRAACCVALVWAGGGAARESLGLGQIGPLLVLLLTMSYTLRGSGRAAAVGAGTAFKILPGVLLFPMALARDWRAVFWGLGTAAMLIAAPAIALMGFAGPKAPEYAGFLLGSPAITSWSIPSSLLRLMDAPQSSGELPGNWIYGNQTTVLHLKETQRLASAATSLLVVVAGGFVLVWRSRGRLAEAQLPVAMAGFVSLALAAAPVCWSHYQILQYPGVALMLGTAAGARRWKLAAVIVGCGAMLYAVPFVFLLHYYRTYGWTAAVPWELYLWTSATPAACVGIFAIAIRMMKEARNNPAARLV